MRGSAKALRACSTHAVVSTESWANSKPAVLKTAEARKGCPGASPRTLLYHGPVAQWRSNALSRRWTSDQYRPGPPHVSEAEASTSPSGSSIARKATRVSRETFNLVTTGSTPVRATKAALVYRSTTSRSQRENTSLTLVRGANPRLAQRRERCPDKAEARSSILRAGTTHG